MVNNSIQQSIPLEFRISYKRHDFIVGQSNKNAIDWIDKFSDWKEDGLIIIGPKSSGKSHLARVLKFKSNCLIKDAEDINIENFNVLKPQNLIIENIERIVNHKFFLHVINTLKEKQYKILLTSRESLKNLEIDLLDLKSRLLVLPQANILLPTDDVLLGIIFKLAKDKGLIINKRVVIFIISHIERSYQSANLVLKKLDELSMQRKKNITIPLVKEILAKYEK